MTCGIYAIVSPSGKRYVGSSDNIERRWRAHRSSLNRGVHHTPALQHAWAKYGADAHTWTILLECTSSDLLATEQRILDTEPCEYNVSVDATSPMKGRKHTEDAKRRMARPGALNSNYGKTLSAAQRQQLDRTGTTHSAETRARYSAERQGAGNAFFGRTHSAKARAQMSAARTGTTMDDATKAKISTATTGSNNPNYGKKASPEKLEKMRQSQLGKKASPETREKMRLAQLRRQERERAAREAAHG